MQRIDSTTNQQEIFAEALQGEYGSFRMANGILVRKQGQLVFFQGHFDGSQETIEIPKLPIRVPLMFTGDTFGCCVLAEPNAGFVKVPELARGKRFVVFATGLLNN